MTRRRPKVDYQFDLVDMAAQSGRETEPRVVTWHHYTVQFMHKGHMVLAVYQHPVSRN